MLLAFAILPGSSIGACGGGVRQGCVKDVVFPHDVGHVRVVLLNFGLHTFRRARMPRVDFQWSVVCAGSP